jgi:hypothetical protein
VFLVSNCFVQRVIDQNEFSFYCLGRPPILSLGLYFRVARNYLWKMFSNRCISAHSFVKQKLNLNSTDNMCYRQG